MSLILIAESARRVSRTPYHLGNRGSNDTDFLMPISMVQQVMEKPVGVVYPGRHISLRLKDVASFIKNIRQSVLRDCQFPQTLKDEVKIIRKPETW
jgi:hypothetical protein